MPSPIEETLERVYRRGHQLRSRRLALRGLVAVVVILGIGVPVIASNEDEGGDRVRVASGPEAVSTTMPTETTSAPTTTGAPSTGPVAPSSTTAQTTAPTTVPQATAGLVCRNSADPRCGEFRWDPAPSPNQPATLRVTYEPAQPVVGQEVVFTLVHSDPDSEARPVMKRWEFGDGEGGASAVACEAPPPRYGPWSPPTPRPGTHSEALRHTYASAATFTARFHSAAGQCGHDPYASAANAVVTVVVRA